MMVEGRGSCHNGEGKSREKGNIQKYKYTDSLTLEWSEKKRKENIYKEIIKI